jgi:hypothetical protein
MLSYADMEKECIEEHFVRIISLTKPGAFIRLKTPLLPPWQAGYICIPQEVKRRLTIGKARVQSHTDHACFVCVEKCGTEADVPHVIR